MAAEQLDAAALSSMTHMGIRQAYEAGKLDQLLGVDPGRRKAAKAKARPKLKELREKHKELRDKLSWLLEDYTNLLKAQKNGVDVDAGFIIDQAFECIADAVNISKDYSVVIKELGIGGDRIPAPPNGAKDESGRAFEALSADKLKEWKAAGVISEEAFQAEIDARENRPPDPPRSFRVPGSDQLWTGAGGFVHPVPPALDDSAAGEPTKERPSPSSRFLPIKDPDQLWSGDGGILHPAPQWPDDD